MKLHFYMKSGNVVTAHNVKDYNIRWDNKEIVGVKLTSQTNFFGKEKPMGLIVGTLTLSQIEAVVKEE